MHNVTIADIITTKLWDWVTIGDDYNEMFLAILTAIPKADKPPTIAKNLRPISVTSIWYRIVAKIFQDRL